jgi:hypothetical protein
LLNTLFYRHLQESGVAEDHLIRFAFDSAEDLLKIGEDLIELQRQNRKVDPARFTKYMQERFALTWLFHWYTARRSQFKSVLFRNP